MVRGQGLSSGGLKVTERTPEFTSRMMGSVLFSMFMLITSDSKGPSSREQGRDPAPGAYNLFSAPIFSLSSKTERKNPLFPAGPLTRPKT